MDRFEQLEQRIPASPEPRDSIEPPDIEGLVEDYRHDLSDRPLWQLAQDVQDRALMYANIVEQLKSGAAPTQIRSRFFEDLRAVSDQLPNPAAERMLTFCLRKLSGFRECLVRLATVHGPELLREMGASHLTAGLTVALGLPPSLEVQILDTPTPEPGAAATTATAQPT